MKTVKLSNLNVGDIFMFKGVMYEITNKTQWVSTCRYVNDKYDTNRWVQSEYLYCDFSNYTKVEV